MTQYDTDPDFWADAERRPKLRQSVWLNFMRLLRLAGLAS